MPKFLFIVLCLMLCLAARAGAEGEVYGVSYIYDADPVREPEKQKLKSVEKGQSDNKKRVIKKTEETTDDLGRRHITYYYSDEFKYKFPFTAVYERNGKTLLYVGVTHAAIDTFKMVKQVFEDYTPEAVILEIESDSPAKTAKCQLAESLYAKRLAEAKRMKVILSDPDISKTHKTFKKSEKFNTKDYEAYWAMRTLAQNAAFGGGIMPISKFLDYYAYKTGAKQSELLTEKQFYAWYKTNFKKEYKPEENLSTSLFTAEREGLRNITNKIFTEEILISRDPALVDNIYKAFQKHDTVLVIFGAAHWGTMEAVLKEMFGKPKVSTKIRKDIETGLELCPGYGAPPTFAL